MTTLTRYYGDQFVNYCFRMGKLEADKTFWNRMNQFLKDNPEQKRRDVERQF